MELVEGIAHLLIASGVGAASATSGVAIFHSYERDTGAPTTLVIRATGGTGVAPRLEWEEQTFQIITRSRGTVSGAMAAARAAYGVLHDLHMQVVSGNHKVLWCRAIAPPADIGPGPGGGEDFLVSTNFSARLVMED